jgi:dTDP-4-dehydrorhamnose reductase
MVLVAREIKDKRVLKLIRLFLQSGVMINGVYVDTEEGCPQGGPLSPLLSIIMLTEFDRELEKRGHTVIGVDVSEMDITDAKTVDTVITAANPDVVVHCAAWTAVDMAEDEDKVNQARAVNADGTQNIANVCKKLGCKMVYISTDYVFDGHGTEPWQPDCKDYAPLSVYGQTKLEGELAVANTLDKYFIIRTAWVFGKNGSNFVRTMLKLAETKGEISVVCDQLGSPTYTADLALLLCDMVLTEKYGTYHATNEGICSWADFAEEIFRLKGKTVKVNRISTAEYQTRAARPMNSRMSKDKLVQSGFHRLPTWQDALKRYLE